MIIALVCVDRNWAIGKGRSRLIVIPDDKKFTDASISKNTIIAGRKTYGAFMEYDLPSDTVKIVLTRNEKHELKGAYVAGSPEAALKEAAKHPGDVYVLGGEETFNSMLEYCDEVQVTYVQQIYEADAYFPNLDKRPEWIRTSESEEQTYFDTIYFYRKYTRRKEYRP